MLLDDSTAADDVSCESPHENALPGQVTVLVKEPYKRGVSAEQLKVFFESKCGEIIYKEKRGRHVPLCLPTKLAEKIYDLQRQERARHYKRAIPLDTNLYAVNEFFLKPETEKERISYAEKLNPMGMAVEFFISHHWGEDFAEFVQSILRHAMLHEGDPRLAKKKKKSFLDIVYWCCAFANNQHTVELGSTITQSPFYLVLTFDGCLGTCMNLNQMMTALTRIWCVYETYLTTTLKNKTFEICTRYGPITVDSSFTSRERDLWVIHMNKLLQHIDVEEAEATVQADKDMIIKEISKLDVEVRGQTDHIKGGDALNNVVRRMVAEQAIFTLAKQGRCEDVRKAIEYRVDPDKKDGQGLAPLTYAVALFEKCVKEVCKRIPMDAIDRAPELVPKRKSSKAGSIKLSIAELTRMVEISEDLKCMNNSKDRFARTFEHTMKLLDCLSKEVTDPDEKGKLDKVKIEAENHKDIIYLLLDNNADPTAMMNALPILTMFGDNVKERQQAMMSVRVCYLEEIEKKQKEIESLRLEAAEGKNHHGDHEDELEKLQKDLDHLQKDRGKFQDFYKTALETARREHIQKVSATFGLAAHASNTAGNLNYWTQNNFMQKAKEIIGEMHNVTKGYLNNKELQQFLQRHSLKGDVPRKYEGDTSLENPAEAPPQRLMVVFTDLEPDDTMGIAQLWQLKLRNNQTHMPPIIVFCSDFVDKDLGSVLDKKLLIAALMTGVTDFSVLTSASFSADVAKMKCPDQLHPKAHYFHEVREDTLRDLCKRIQDTADEQIDGRAFEIIDVYIAAPGRGIIGDVWENLGEEWTKNKRWRIAMYSGRFNIENMAKSDVDAIEAIARRANEDGEPLLDVGKFPFFGGDNCHPWTASLATFMMETFPQELTHFGHRGKLLAAALKLFNDEHNSRLVEPKDSLWQGRTANILDAGERRKFEKIRTKYQHADSDALMEYAKAVVSDHGLFAKLQNFKKSTFMSFAHGSCESPLCDQLIFLAEWMIAKRSDVFEDIVYGRWSSDGKLSKIDKKEPIYGKEGIVQYVKQHPKGCIGYQPALWDPYDEDALMRMRKLLQDYVLHHIKCVHKKSEEDDKHAPADAGNLVYSPKPTSMKKVQEIIDHTSKGTDLASALSRRGYSLKAQPCSPNGGTLMMVFTDLQPESVMAIAHLEQRKRELKQLKEDPVIAFVCDFNDKDRGTIFDKKLLTAALMLGKSDPAYLLAPDPVKIGKEGGDDPPIHPRAQSIHDATEETYKKLTAKWKGFDGKRIDIYIMGPCKGALAQIFPELPRHDLEWRISIYSGSFNIRNMPDEDQYAIERIASVAKQPLVDVAKVAFFGKKPHRWTASLTTFANESFALHVTHRGSMLAAVLQEFDAEHNASLVKPKKKDGIYTIFDKDLSAEFVDHFEKEIKPLWKYKDVQALREYCKAIYEHNELWHGVKKFKKSTIAALANGGCDSPLSSLLIFLYEWLKDEMGEVLAKSITGSWKIVRDSKGDKSHTEVAELEPVDNASESAQNYAASENTLAIQPRLKNPMDEDTLKTMREVLEREFLKHLQGINIKISHRSLRSLRTAGNLIYAPTRVEWSRASEWIQAIGDTWDMTHVADRLRNLWPQGLDERLTRGCGKHLMLVFTDLEVDQSMAVALLWHWKSEKEQLGVEPLLVTVVNDRDDDDDIVAYRFDFSQKLLVASLMLGIKEFHFLSATDQIMSVPVEARRSDQRMLHKSSTQSLDSRIPAELSAGRKAAFTITGAAGDGEDANGAWFITGTHNGKPKYENAAGCTVTWECTINDWAFTNLGTAFVAKWTVSCGGHCRYYKEQYTAIPPLTGWISQSVHASGSITLTRQAFRKGDRVIANDSFSTSRYDVERGAQGVIMTVGTGDDTMVEFEGKPATAIFRKNLHKLIKATEEASRLIAEEAAEAEAAKKAEAAGELQKAEEAAVGKDVCNKINSMLGAKSTAQRSSIASARPQTMESICERIKEFKSKGGAAIDLYVMTHCRGNLDAVFQQLHNDGVLWQDFTWNVTIYTGFPNSESMEDGDKKILQQLSARSHVVDLSSACFFGEPNRHLHTFAEFAHHHFAAELNWMAPQLAATLKILNNNINSKSVHPDRISALFTEALTPAEQKNFDTKIKPLYMQGELAKYCQALCDDKDLHEKICDSVGSTVRACANNGCDLPLCCQTMFLREWLKEEAPEAIVEDVGEFVVRAPVNRWSSDCDFGKAADVRTGEHSEFRATQPRLKDPSNEDIMSRMRNATMDYLMKHLQTLNRVPASAPSSPTKR